MRTLSEWLQRLSSRHAVLGLSAVAALLLQCSVFPHLAVFGLRPDLLGVVVACWGLLYGPAEGFVGGLAVGLVQDLAFGGYLGLFALAKTLTGFVAGVAESKIFKETIWVPTAAVGLLVLFHELVVWICLRALSVPAPVRDIFTVGFGTAAYSLVTAPLVYRQLFLYRAAKLARERETTGGNGQALARR